MRKGWASGFTVCVSAAPHEFPTLHFAGLCLALVWEIKAYRASLGDVVPGPDKAAMFLEDSLTYGQTQTGAVFRLAGTEGLKDPIQFFFRNAGAGVGYVQDHILNVVVFLCSDGNGQRPATRPIRFFLHPLLP